MQAEGTHGGVYFVPARTMVTKWSSTASFVLGQYPKGVLAGPRTPWDCKSHLFVTNQVAIQPFCKPPRPADAEFRCGSRQIGLTPSISTVFGPSFGPKITKSCFLGEKKTPLRGTQQLPWRAWSQIRPIRAQGAHVEALGIPPHKGPMWRPGGTIPPHKGPWGPM